MPRRRESLLDTLLVLPWWIGLSVGAFGYVAIAVVLPRVSTDQTFAAIAKGLQPFGKFWFALCALAALGSAIRAFFIARKFDQQKGLDDLRSLSWRQFESIVGEAFRRRGYSVLENAVDGPDGGVDLVLRKDGAKYYVQCKQWKQRQIGVKPVRELFGVISARGVQGGFVVSSGSYTRDAREFAQECGIALIDGPALEEVVRDARSPESSAGPTVRERDSISQTAITSAPPCPKCGGEMVTRTAKRGANAGNDFWGCAAYPRCRGTRGI